MTRIDAYEFGRIVVDRPYSRNASLHGQTVDEELNDAGRQIT
jgi:hypothetical protein